MGSCLAGVLLASACSCLVGCGGDIPPLDGKLKEFENPAVTLRANADEGKEISDSLYGLFLEDINYATYAMDDNLILNSTGKFEQTRWSAVGSAELNWEETGSISAVNPGYLELSVYDAGTGIKYNGDGYYPLAVVKDTKYHFSTFLRTDGFTGNMKIAVKNASGKVFAEKTVEIAEQEEWVKYSTELTALDSADKNIYLEITFDEVGVVHLDGMAFETLDSTVGIKNYFYNAINDLNPSFIRFPGGCVIEGKNMDGAYDWKNSIGVDGSGKPEKLTYNLIKDGETTQVTTTGEPITRTANMNIWVGVSYDMSYQLGFYDYFLLCESVGASAIPIVNCGMACMIQSNGADFAGRNGNGVDDYIQDALDLVAFAKGSVDSADANEAAWAQVRADMGHPEPFEMDYLGIGNEQWGNKYFGYYQRFVEAFKAARGTNPELYNGVELIVGNGPSITDVERNGTGGTAKRAAEVYKNAGRISSLSEYGVHDHHYYMNYSEFFQYANLYDGYTRGGDMGYDVFVGEYSANQISNPYFPSAKNAWITALAEAAYMTGLERNGDVVKLAAYAPMFGNATDSFNQWQVDMMYYTNTELVLSANYYVQQLFAQNAGDFALTTERENATWFDSQFKLVYNSQQTADKLYYVMSKDSATGDIIIKLVNASGENVDVNISIDAMKMKGYAEVVKLQNGDTTAFNSLTEKKITPQYLNLGVDGVIGYTAEAGSVTSIRVKAK